MKTKPLVTIVTPCYNHEQFVVEALESVKNQTYTNIQHIIIDDFSTDNSVRVIEKWIEENEYKCTFIKHDKNQGICKTLNESISLTKGKYWGGCTSDDAFLPEKIQKQVGILESVGDEVACVYSDSYLIDGQSNPIDGHFISLNRKFITPPSGDIFSILMEGNFIPGMTVLMKVSVFNELGVYDEKLSFEDYDLYLRVASKYNWYYSTYVSTKYRLHNNNLHKKIKNWSVDFLKIYYKFLDNPIAKEKYATEMNKLAIYDRKTAAEILRQHNPKFLNKSLVLKIKYKIPIRLSKLFFK